MVCKRRLVHELENNNTIFTHSSTNVNDPIIADIYTKILQKVVPQTWGKHVKGDMVMLCTD